MTIKLMVKNKVKFCSDAHASPRVYYIVVLFLEPWKTFEYFGMVGIVFSSSFHQYYIHGSTIYTTHIKRNSRTT